MNRIDVSKISKELRLPDGSRIVLLDMLAAPESVPFEQVENNVYRLSADGAVCWQIVASRAVHPRSPFTGMGWDDDGLLLAYRWDGTEYLVDVATGKATPHRLAK